MSASRAWLWAFAALCCLCSLIFAEEELKSIPLRTHSLQAPYLDSDMQSRWFDFGGDTIVRTDRYVRLTPELTSRTGWLFSRVPLTATNWEIEVEFKISGTGTLYGDGMAMWLTKQRAQTGPVFGFMDKFEGLGIFIDTYKNNRPGVVFPYIMAMVGDGKTVYDKENDGKSNELAGCSARGVRNQNFPTKLRLTYFQDKSLTLDLQYKSEDKWENCFKLGPEVKIPSVAYLGFSAETGELVDDHDIISVETKNLYAPTAGNSPSDTGKGRNWGTSHKAKKAGGTGGWGWLFIKFCAFGFFLVGLYAGFVAWRNYSSGRSRF